MADQALRLCGEVSDGLIVGNMCPPGYTLRAQELMLAGSQKAGRRPPKAIVKYVPCSVSKSREEAIRAVKPVIAAMLGAYWKAYKDSPAVRATISEGSGIERSDLISILDDLSHGKDPVDALDERFVAAYAVAGTPQECLSKCEEFAGYGVSEIVMSFIGSHPETQMKLLSDAISRDPAVMAQC